MEASRFARSLELADDEPSVAAGLMRPRQRLGVEHHEVHAVIKLNLGTEGGEVLGGITQSAMRTGRTQEANEFLDKMLVMLAGTPYEPTAKRWKADPKAVEKTSLLCMNCHEPGRLEATVTKLNKTN